eukprot:6921607-Prymnesium_polylepis.1
MSLRKDPCGCRIPGNAHTSGSAPCLARWFAHGRPRRRALSARAGAPRWRRCVGCPAGIPSSPRGVSGSPSASNPT